MKQLILIRKTIAALTAIIGFSCSACAQEIWIGAHGAFPFAGDVKDAYSFNAGADASFYYPIKETAGIGITTGYTRYFGKEQTIAGIKFENRDLSYIPLAASARGVFSEHFLIIGDIGYAFGLEDNSGGFYYAGKFGWTNGNVDAYGFYKGISGSDDGFDHDRIDVLGVGVVFKVL